MILRKEKIIQADVAIVDPVKTTIQAIVSPLATTGTSSIVAVVSAVASGSSRSITCWVPSHATPSVPNRQ